MHNPSIPSTLVRLWQVHLVFLEHREADKYHSSKSGTGLDIQSQSVHPSQNGGTSSKANQDYSMYLNHTAPKIQHRLSIADDGQTTNNF